MRLVAAAAAINTNSGVLKDERSAFVDMTFKTGLFILQAMCHHAGSCAHLPGGSVGTMRIVAIRTLHESFIDAVLDGHRKLRPDICMTAVTEICLRLGQKLFGCSSFVDGMAIGADHVCGAVRTAANVCATELLCMTCQASVEYLLWSKPRKRDNERLIPFCSSVGLAGTVTTLAALLLELYPLVDQTLCMCIAIKRRPDIRMAGTANRVACISCWQCNRFFFLTVCSAANE